MKLKFTPFITILLSAMFFISNMSFAATYYIRPTGKNTNNGTSSATAWFDLTKVNSKVFVAGDIIYLEQGFTYNGNIYFDQADGGTAANPVIVTSWNSAGALTGRATINSGTNSAFYAYNSAGIKITDLNFIGSTSAKDGVAFYCDLANNAKKDYVYIENIDVQGYKNGIGIGSWNNTAGFTNVTVLNSNLFNNVRTGLVTYAQGRLSHQNIIVSYCKAYNNFGDISNTTTNTGSGIILAGVDGGNVNHCIAYNNGQNNRNPGGGPVGIWCYEANNIIIEYNESYDNDAGLNHDGGGFDIDGGSTNCIMQYNYSHNNEGPGYLFAQFQGSSVTMNNNICRYNISENDARKNSSGAIYFWAAGGYSITNTYVYGNTIYMTPSSNGTANGIYIAGGTNTTNTNINNNIFVTTGGLRLIDAQSTSGISFKGNNYWSSGSTFSINWGGSNYSSLSAFKGTGQEAGTGLQVDPMLTNPNAGITIGNTDNLATLTGYQLQAGSPMVNAGITITSPGSRDYYGNTIPLNSLFDIGAHELQENTMPISLTSFTAKKQLNTNIITWQTSTEINNSYFELERSLNAIDFTTINTQKSKGNTNQNYFFNDNDKLENTVYYRLKQTDFDGKSTTSKTISLKADFDGKLSVYPNPFSNQTTISATKNIASIKVISASGQTVFTKKLNQKNYILAGVDFVNGFYILEVVYNDASKEVVKLLKQ